jgi:hypothetical protein
MIGIRTPETANYFVAKLENILDIPCVLRLVFDRLSAPTARPGINQRFPILSQVLRWVFGKVLR